jgi:hypothetical protein
MGVEFFGAPQGDHDEDLLIPSCSAMRFRVFCRCLPKHGATLTRLGVNPDNGVGQMLAKIETLPDAEGVIWSY